MTGLPFGKIARATCAVCSGTTYARFTSSDIAHPWLAGGRIVAQAHRAGRPLITGATPNSPPISKCGRAQSGSTSLSLRRERKLGIKQIRNELVRQHDLMLSHDTIHRVLIRHGEQVLKRPRRRIKGKLRYSRPVPGDRAQMDISKICPGVYQYTAIDDCSRYAVFSICPRRTAANTLDFLDRVNEEMPFAIQRIQSDRGREFFAEAVQQRLIDWGIKFGPIPPRSPHMNGKVERSHRAALEEFWPMVEPNSEDIADRVAEWQHHWNWSRPHSGLDGASPIDRVVERSDQTPLREEVEALFDPAKARIRHPDYRVDQALASMK